MICESCGSKIPREILQLMVDDCFSLGAELSSLTIECCPKCTSEIPISQTAKKSGRIDSNADAD